MSENATFSKADSPLVSIIVPVYNVENYIQKCLDSIIQQTYQNLEVLLIDDGTPDRSGEICEEYAAKDARLKVYHKQNGGLSDARNFGIEHATGEYLMFIDSDDYADLDYVQFLMDLLEGGKYQMALCSLHYLYLASGKFVDKGNGQKMVLTGKETIEMMCYHDEIETAAYAKIMHRNLFDHVRFPVGKVFEDIGTSYLLFDQCDQINCWFMPKYYYVIRDDSIVTRPFTMEKLDFIEMTEKMANYVNEKYPDLKQATLRREVYANFSTLNHMLNVKDKDLIQIRKSIIDFIKKNSRTVLKDKKAPRRDTVAIRSLRLGLPIYRLFWRFYLRIQRGA